MKGKDVLIYILWGVLFLWVIWMSIKLTAMADWLDEAYEWADAIGPVEVVEPGEPGEPDTVQPPPPPPDFPF